MKAASIEAMLRWRSVVQASVAGVLGVLCLAALSGPTVAYASDPFTIVALPDTQYYSRDVPSIFNAQTQWIVDNAAAKNIRFVTHLGDIVDNGDDLTQWAKAKASMGLLDAAGMPYGTALGNHDNAQYMLFPPYSQVGYDPNAVNYRNNFGPALYAGKSWYGSSPSQKSNYEVISGGGRDFLFLHLAMDTPQAELDWAQQVLNQNRDKPTVVTTHRYLEDYRLIDERYRSFSLGFFEEPWVPDGIVSESFFQNFIRPNTNIFMVLSGHCDGEYRQKTPNDAGLPVFEMLADYQTFSPNGGDGWMRLMTFDTDAKTITVQTYSPTLARFRTTQDGFQETLAAVPVYGPYIGQAMGLTPAETATLIAQLTANNGAALWQMAYADGQRDPSFTLSVDFAAYAVPEPSTISLLIVGMLLGLGACWRRRRFAPY